MYSTDTVCPNVTLFADVTTGNYYKAGIEGLHLYSNNARRIAYEASFKSYSTYYWGIGVDDGMTDENKTRYRLLDIDVKAAHLWRVGPNLYLGPSIEFNYTSARNRANTARWREQPLKTYIIEAGGIMQFDTRNNYTFATHGWLGEVSFGYNQGLADPYKSDFYSVGFNISSREAALWFSAASV